MSAAGREVRVEAIRYRLALARHYGKLLPGRSEQVADRLDALHRGSA